MGDTRKETGTAKFGPDSLAGKNLPDRKVFSVHSVLGEYFKWPKGSYVGIDHITGAIITDKVMEDGTLVKEVGHDLDIAVTHLQKRFPEHQIDKDREPIYLLLKRSEDFSGVFKRKAQINPGDVTNYAKFTGEYFESAGLLEDPITSKKRIVDGVTGEFQENNSLSINTRASRVRLKGAIISFVEREVIEGLSVHKAAPLEILHALVEFTRLRIDLANTELFEIQKELRGYKDLSDNEKLKLIEDIKAVTGSYLAKVWVAPFLVPTREAAIMLVGCKAEKQKANSLVLGREKGEKLFKEKSVLEHVDEGKLIKANERIKEATDLLQRSLSGR